MSSKSTRNVLALMMLCAASATASLPGPTEADAYAAFLRGLGVDPRRFPADDPEAELEALVRRIDPLHGVIGANAVVLDDVPAGAVAVGIPARIVRHSSPRPLPVGACA